MAVAVYWAGFNSSRGDSLETSKVIVIDGVALSIADLQ